MPSAAARRLYEDQIPSFMSIIDPDSENYDDTAGIIPVVDSKFMAMDSTYGVPPFPGQTPQLSQHLSAMPADALHRHHDSTSTHNSADSSPTTTLTTDTSSLSDPSPSSSPDSPVNLIPLNNYPGTTFGSLSTTMNTLTVNEPSANNHFQRPMTSPSPRRRNMKGLSIQPPFAASLSTTLVSEPSSPSFIKPKIPGMKRKPSQLSLKTDTQGLNIRPTTIEAPGSPSVVPILQRRALKHSTSSPHMLSGMKSATFGPAGGMTFPTLSERGQSGLSEVLRPSRLNSSGSSSNNNSNNNRVSLIMEEDSSPIRAQHASCAAMDFEPFRDESEANEDQKSPGYPDGPIAIYDDNVYLYLEPTADEAAKFDVVINVAREVHNPFDDTFGKRRASDVESPIPDTALTTDSFATAFEYPMEDRVETPTTPKAANTLKEPEYIHMPWDHNTDIATDLMSLCETIEKRTKEGKKVLVHCQQGASRSASLIIAYGLYQNPGISVNDAYYRAQTKSRWISPNMRLMYCLQDFQKEVMKKRLPRSAAGPRSGRSPTKHRLTLSADAIEIKPKEPLSAPLPEESPKDAQATSPQRSPQHSRGKSTPNLEAISPGPSSAPSSFSWSEQDVNKSAGEPGKFNLDKLLNPPRFFESESEETFPPRGSSFFKAPPSPGLKPPATSLGFTQAPKLSFNSVPSLAFQPPPSPGFPSMSQGFKPPPSPGFPPVSQSFRPPPSPGFPPVSQSFRPPPSPGFPPVSQEFKPPPSPGFGAHRFGNGPQSFGFSSLNFGSMEASLDSQLHESAQQDVHVTRALPDDDALMSPRAETMTNNPLHDSFGEMAGMKFVEVPPTPNEEQLGLFSPRETMFPRDPFYPFGRPTQVTDPRSPPTKGETPIVRSIDEVL
ncbi:hypothetical protein JX266_000703 [Neoarthrinium moseri]|uniref:uncharacterized protein n=1 Tax=Neoarthrinium moseri TaxID=1658444 RepID=UPI001FDBB02F|nr:uncharacterized protein JN550_000041 [Neoarthrinium moseri]KAI1854585.1 hypothetical protein JX266_000703 [Neoarthrinium moseri]KAI1877859.1 hypothetical protein JN550_000041 [Neoarthrinium moseri]